MGNGFNRHIWDVKVKSRDGAKLSVDVYLPEDEGRYPTVLLATPYDNTMKTEVEMAEFFARHGYAYVQMDVRGRYDSEGDWVPFMNEGPDEYDVIEWAAQQSWSTGKVGMMGGSYRGWVQWAAAKLKPPHLTTMVPTATGGDYMREYPFYFGIPTLWLLGWLNFVGGHSCQNASSPTIDWEKVFRSLPIIDMPKLLYRELPIWREWMSHPDLDDYWSRIIFKPFDFEGIDIPILHITGWYDGDQPGALHYYNEMIEHSPAADMQYIIIGPWDHAGTRFPKQVLGGVDFTDEAVIEMSKIHLSWFDRWLKGTRNEVDDWPKTRYFVMGENIWRNTVQSWPPKGELLTLYLGSENGANTLLGDGKLIRAKTNETRFDEFVYNPSDPVVTTPGFDLYGERIEYLLDNRYIQRRDDVLVYTSDPLNKEIFVVGYPVVDLYASSDCPDTDFFVTLSDVSPNGASIPVAHGGLRGRYREGLNKQILAEPGKIYTYSIKLNSTCVCFMKGHKIRLHATSSDFPSFAPNNNTGNHSTEDTERRIAHNRVYYHGKSASKTILTIINH